MSSPHDHIVDRLFLAIENDDISEIERLYADDFHIWHSFDDRKKSKAENLAMIANSVGAGRRSYRVIERLVVGDRMVQRLELTVTSRDGSRTCRMNLVLFLTVAGGKIASIHEYIDSRDALAFMDMVAATRSQAPVPANGQADWPATPPGAKTPSPAARPYIMHQEPRS